MTGQQAAYIRGHLEHLLGPVEGETLCRAQVRSLIEPGTWPLCARCEAIRNRQQRTPRKVSTVPEINALPAGTVLLGAPVSTGGRNLYQKPGLGDTDDAAPGWWCMGIGPAQG